jgi:hypothetical protein
MRHEAVFWSLSWIPSEAIQGMMKLPFNMGVGHYDDPPPEHITPELVEQMRAEDKFRFANELRAWVDVDDDGTITGAGYSGGAHMGATTLKVGRLSRTVAGFTLPLLQREPEVAGSSVRFVQTAGGRTGFPAPRKVKRPPYVQWKAPTVWTTLSLTITADGTSTYEVVGASKFPRLWFYDTNGDFVQKSGLVDSKNWFDHSFGDKTPWGEEDSPAFVTAVETALERQLSLTIMRGGTKPRIRKLTEGELLTEQGQLGDELFLLLDGMLRVEVDGEAVADVGPGAVVGERALLEQGMRTSTLRAVTPCKVAVASAEELDRDALAELSEGHRREEQRS